jgi:hypothetical protein
VSDYGATSGLGFACTCQAQGKQTSHKIRIGAYNYVQLSDRFRIIEMPSTT